MKYTNISLRKNKICSEYGLVKYNDSLNDILDDCNLSNNMINDIKNISNNDINSDTKSYMINYYNNQCFGGLVIEKDSNDKDRISVRIELDETKFRKLESMEKLENILMDSLKIFLYDKKCIDFSFLERNKNMMSGFSHTYDNSVINTRITRLINEIKETEKNLSDWNLNWYRECITSEIYDGAKFNLFDNFYDEDMIKKIFYGTITLEEVFYKLNKIKLSSINSKNNQREIIFDINGDVILSKISKKMNGEDYHFNFNVMNNYFIFNGIDKLCNQITISDNKLFTEYSNEDVSVIEYKDSKNKHYSYVSPIIDNSSIKIDIFTMNNIIEKCYVDFRTHKNGNNKVNGIYGLRIVKEDKCFKLVFVSRKGLKRNISLSNLNNIDKELYSTITFGLTPDILDELINKILIVINNEVNCNDRQVFYINNGIISHILNTDKYALNFLKQIKGELPIPHLNRTVDNFIREKDGINNKKSYNKIKMLKK